MKTALPAFNKWTFQTGIDPSEAEEKKRNTTRRNCESQLAGWLPAVWLAAICLVGCQLAGWLPAGWLAAICLVGGNNATD